jgi:hypothetical protein
MELDERRCDAGIWVGPVTGLVCCQLENGHPSRWHRSDEAGWEWSEGQLWPLPPSEAA